MKDVIVDYSNAMAEAVGTGNGVTADALSGLTGRAAEIHADLERRRQAGELPFYDLPRQDLGPILNLADKVRPGRDNVVVLGIGGSALGARALAKALLPPYHDFRADRKSPRLLVADNIDPDWFLGLLAAVDLERTVFIVASKSGGTAETMSQFLIARDLLRRRFGEEGYRRRMIAITDANAGYLRDIVRRDGLDWLPVPDGVGGRFTVLTAVGLLPAAIAGIDIKALLAGAARMEERARAAELMKNPAYLLASLFYLMDQELKKNILVMIPYASGLLELAEWFQQLWAESLGKAVHTDGSPAHTGSTPVRALGATDQHSQVQLYMEGPTDKLTVFVRVAKFENAATVPPAFDDIKGVGYLGGHSLAELIAAEESATAMALGKAGRPNLRLELPALDPESLGQVMFLLEVATVFGGGLYRVNALDQPGVELGKRYAYALMGRSGFESEAKDVAGWEKQRPLRRV
jgi:glucose-6-phosphate isomerase